jgi:hypothetical protein
MGGEEEGRGSGEDLQELTFGRVFWTESILSSIMILLNFSHLLFYKTSFKSLTKLHIFLPIYSCFFFYETNVFLLMLHLFIQIVINTMNI